MPNRTKTERNGKIMEYLNRGYRYIAIARMFKMTPSAVNMVIHRERERMKVTYGGVWSPKGQVFDGITDSIQMPTEATSGDGNENRRG